MLPVPCVRSFITAGLFQFLKAGPHMPRDCAARHLHGHDGGSAFQKGNHQNSHDIEKGVLFLGRFGHVGRDRADQSVAQKDSQERSHQSSSDLVSNLFGRTAERSHGDDHTKYGSHDSEAGKGIGHRAEGGGGRRRVLMVNLQVRIEHLVEIERIDAGDGHAQGVTDKIAHAMVLEE